MNPTLQHGVDEFRRELQSRNLSPATIRTYAATLSSVEAYAKASDITRVSDITSDTLRLWRMSLDQQPSTQGRMVVQVKSLVRYWCEREWMDKDPGRHLRPPRFVRTPTLPYTEAEMRAILRAAPRPRIYAFVLLMRYAGVAIQDAATLRREDVKGGIVFLRRAKTGEAVTVPLPPRVDALLRDLDPVSPEHFFWTGRCQRETVAKRYGGALRKVFLAAGIEGGHSHRFRDTFAVELLKAGTSMEDVSMLLGHSSIKITEQYYAPWCPRRRERLEKVVQKAWGHDTLLGSL